MSEFLGVEYEGMPSGPAAGAINGVNEAQILAHIRDLARSEAGFIPFGSIGTRWNGGNSGQTYFHDPLTGETVNALGLPGVGIDRGEEIIKEGSKICEDYGKVFFVSVSSLAGEVAENVLPELAYRVLLAGGANTRVEVNFSCPNIVTSGGGRKPILAFDPLGMVRTRAAIKNQIGNEMPYSEKLSPYLGENAALIPEVTSLYGPGLRRGSVAISGFNTDPNHTLMRDGKPVLNIHATVGDEEITTHAGGMSGPALSDKMYELQQTFMSQIPDDVPFIAANGVNTGAEILRRTSGERAAIAALAVTRYMEGEKVGRSYGATATLMAQEYYEALDAA